MCGWNGSDRKHLYSVVHTLMENNGDMRDKAERFLALCEAAMSLYVSNMAVSTLKEHKRNHTPALPLT